MNKKQIINQNRNNLLRILRSGVRNVVAVEKLLKPLEPKNKSQVKIITPPSKRNKINIKTEILKDTTLEDLGQGILLILKNAENLIDEARLLYENNKKQRCIVLLIAALEELAKIAFIQHEVTLYHGKKFILHRTRLFMHEFKNHEEKQKTGLGHLEEDLMDKLNFVELNEAVDSYQSRYEHTRQAGLYIEYYRGKFYPALENNKALKKLLINPKFFIEKLEKYLYINRHTYGNSKKDCIGRLINTRLILTSNANKWKIKETKTEEAA